MTSLRPTHACGMAAPPRAGPGHAASRTLTLPQRLPIRLALINARKSGTTTACSGLVRHWRHVTDSGSLIGVSPIRTDQHSDLITRADADLTPRGSCLNEVLLDDSDLHDHEVTGWAEPVDTAEPATMAEWSA